MYGSIYIYIESLIARGCDISNTKTASSREVYLKLRVVDVFVTVELLRLAIIVGMNNWD